MDLSDDLDVVVGYLTSYYLDGGTDLAAQFGDQAPTLAEEMGQMLEELLNSDTPYGAMFEEYRRDPEPNEAELIGALEVLDESMPEVTMRLQGYLAAFHDLEQPGVVDLIETSDPEAIIDVPEVEEVNSLDDGDDDDEYREENTYLTGNVEDHSTSAMYYEGEDTDVEPNQTEE